MYFYFIAYSLRDVFLELPPLTEARAGAAPFPNSRNDYLAYTDFNYFYERCGLYIQNTYNATYNDLLLGKIGQDYMAVGPLHYELMENQLKRFILDSNDLTKFVNKVLQEKISRDSQPLS